MSAVKQGNQVNFPREDLRIPRTSGQAFNKMLFFAFGKHQYVPSPSFSSFYTKIKSHLLRESMNTLCRLILLIVIDQTLQSFQTDILTHLDGIAGKFSFLLLDYRISK